MKWLDDKVAVAPQIVFADIAEAAAQGVRLIVNNRPDDEEPGQPPGAEIEAAARAAGVEYRHIPVSLPGLSQEQVSAMGEALEAAGDGKVLAFCRSGTRSTYLWALARSEAGEDGEAIMAKAVAAGYDLSPLAAHLRR